MSGARTERELVVEQHRDDVLGDDAAVELKRGLPWKAITREQRGNRLTTLDPGIKPGSLRDRLLRGLTRR
jgi:hypothetical protein